MLDEILASKRQEVARAKAALAPEELQQRVARHTAQRSFRQAIHRPGTLSVIAELKRKSPSRGMLRERFDPVSLAQGFEEAGAAALSVLTDEPYFGGHLEFLRDVKHFTELPVLRKDFILEPYQVDEAAFYQADAVLLIVRILSDEALRACLQAARQLALDALVEVHAEADLARALGAGAELIGINHRDLDTLQLDPGLTARLMPRIPKERVVVAESGLHSAADVAQMRALGVHAVLVGEALMAAADPSAKLRELLASG
jgi:indole-3-glycerol phosphate synthase